MSVNFTTAELQVLALLAGAQREVLRVAVELEGARSSRKQTRQQQAEQLRQAAQALAVIEQNLSGNHWRSAGGES